MRNHLSEVAAMILAAVLSAPAPASAQEESEPGEETPAPGESEPADEPPPPEEGAPAEETPPPEEGAPAEESGPPQDVASPTTVPPSQPTPPMAPLAPVPPPVSSPPSDSPAAPTPVPSADASECEERDDGECVEECEKDDDGECASPFGWFSIAPEVGYGFFPASQFETTVKGYDATLTIEQRHAFIGKVHLDLGGDGIAVEIAPFIAVEGSDISALKVDAGQGMGGGLGGDFVAVGGQLNLVYRFGRRVFFPHIGVGFHGAYLVSDDIDYGAELYGRIPIGFSAYFAKNAAFVMEVGLMYGATGIKANLSTDPDELAAELGIDPESFDPNNPPTGMDPAEVEAMKQAMIEDAIHKAVKFGAGFGVDVAIGLRFP